MGNSSNEINNLKLQFTNFTQTQNDSRKTMRKFEKNTPLLSPHFLNPDYQKTKIIFDCID